MVNCRVAKILGIACAALMLSVATAQEQPKKNWKDRAEYDLYDAIVKETAPAKRLELLTQWKQKYAASDYKQERATIFLNTYQSLGKLPEMVASAKELIEIDPKDLNGLYWLTRLTQSLPPTDANNLATGEMAAKGLLSNLDTFFAKEKKPANTSEDAWTKARNDMDALATKTLGWIAMQKQDAPSAEKAFAQSLEKVPNDAEISYWMYTVIRAGKDVKRYSEALFHLSRAASMSGPGALADAQRKQVDDFFVKAYSTFHGQDDAGLAELRKLSLSQTMPPADFRIENANEIAIRKMTEFRKSKPQLAFWYELKKELTGDNGETYFRDGMKGAALPGKQSIEGVEFSKLKGYVVEIKGGNKEVVIKTEETGAPEITLKLDGPVKVADPGTVVEFEGVAQAFVKDPFMLTFECERANVTGLEAGAAPVTKKAGGARKAPVRKKK